MHNHWFCVLLSSSSILSSDSYFCLFCSFAVYFPSQSFFHCNLFWSCGSVTNTGAYTISIQPDDRLILWSVHCECNGHESTRMKTKEQQQQQYNMSNSLTIGFDWIAHISARIMWSASLLIERKSENFFFSCLIWCILSSLYSFLAEDLFDFKTIRTVEKSAFTWKENQW